MNRFTQYLIMILLLAGSVVFASLNGVPHAWHLLSMVCAVLAGYFIHKWSFGKL